MEETVFIFSFRHIEVIRLVGKNQEKKQRDEKEAQSEKRKQFQAVTKHKT